MASRLTERLRRWAWSSCHQAADAIDMKDAALQKAKQCLVDLGDEAPLDLIAEIEEALYLSEDGVRK